MYTQTKSLNPDLLKSLKGLTQYWLMIQFTYLHRNSWHKHTLLLILIAPQNLTLLLNNNVKFVKEDLMYTVSKKTNISATITLTKITKFIQLSTTNQEYCSVKT